jgi:hypothetical protein
LTDIAVVVDDDDAADGGGGGALPGQYRCTFALGFGCIFLRSRDL